MDFVRTPPFFVLKSPWHSSLREAAEGRETVVQMAVAIGIREASHTAVRKQHFATVSVVHAKAAVVSQSLPVPDRPPALW